MASKIPVKDILFTTFEIKHLEACKGFLSGTVSLQGRDVRLVATHLQHSTHEEAPSREEIDRRTAQLALIRTHVQEVGLPAILAGDLNICAAEEYPLLASFWKPAHEEPAVTYTNRGVREIWGNPPLREYRLDFIRSNQLNVRVERVEALYTAEGLQLADHWPLRAGIKSCFD